MKNKIKKIMGGALAAMVAVLMLAAPVNAATFSVSPMNQKIILKPGEVFEGSFKVSNPASSTEDFNYKIEVQPFYVDGEYNPVYTETGDYNQIVEWVTVKNPKGTIAPNGVVTVYYQIDVPADAPAGGQYTSLTTMQDLSGEASAGVNIATVPAIAHIIYAEVAGTTERSGEVVSIDVPSFVFGGGLSAKSSVKNTGNAHGTAKYTLKVTPLFSDEPVFTNEEDPTTMTILPDRTYYNETVWPDTPFFGVYNVVYNVEFEGISKEVSKMVIICPIWLMFVVIFGVALLIVWIVAKKRAKR